MSITLPDHIQVWIDRQVAEGRFDSEDAVIANAVEQAMDEYRWEEDEDLLEAIAEADRGDVVPWTPELMDELMERARENSCRGHQVSDDIKY
jgi:Arc/MetJ-type ribon-helix-helix transcriptional regulator